MHTGLVISVVWYPAEFAADFATIHRIAHVVSRSIIDVLVPILTFAHEFTDELDNHLVIYMVVVGADDIRLTHLTFVEDEVNGCVVIVDMYPVTDLLASTVEFWFDIAQDVGDLAGDKFFDVLVGTVVVAAVANGCLDTEAAYPGTDEVVRTGFAGRVGTGWFVGR